MKERTTMPETILKLESDFELQSDAVSVEQQNAQGTKVCVTVNKGCEGCASRMAADFLGAHDHSAFHAAHEVAIQSIRKANETRCPMALTVTR